MKIEKVNDNQIRCTLTKEDLVSRELKISELAYGTEKAKSLFRDMMQQANYEFGFEAEDIPLMIEAIPLNAECIVLIITKVEDPEELDTRFARFAPSSMDDEDSEEFDTPPAEEVLDLFRKLQNSNKTADVVADNIPAIAQPQEKSTAKPRVFSFQSLQQVMNVAKVVAPHFDGFSALYKDEKSGQYLLVLLQQDCNVAVFERACNIISEYGSLKVGLSNSIAFLEEHFEPLITNNALHALNNA